MRIRYAHIQFTVYAPPPGAPPQSPPVNQLRDVEGEESPLGIHIGARLYPWAHVAYRDGVEVVATAKDFDTAEKVQAALNERLIPQSPKAKGKAK